MDIRNMTSQEVRRIIMEGAAGDEPRSMSYELALEIVECDHFDKSLTAWAWDTIAEELRQEYGM